MALSGLPASSAPLPPGPHSGASAMKAMHEAAQIASTALPPARSSSAPASAVRESPAAITPAVTSPTLPWNRAGGIPLPRRSAAAGPRWRP